MPISGELSSPRYQTAGFCCSSIHWLIETCCRGERRCLITTVSMDAYMLKCIRCTCFHLRRHTSLQVEHRSCLICLFACFHSCPYCTANQADVAPDNPLRSMDSTFGCLDLPRPCRPSTSLLKYLYIFRTFRYKYSQPHAPAAVFLL